jgi:hypothetical protein
VANQLIERGRASLRERGAFGAARHAGQRVRDRLYWQETFIWYELRLDAPGVGDRELPDGLELVRATEQDLALASQTGKQPDQVVEALRSGHDLWLVREGEGRAAFSCWIYRGSAPQINAHGGWFDLPPGVVCLEDSVTNPDFRGRGVAPAAWSQLALLLAREGLEAMVTRVRDDNAPSRKACLKAGFEEIGTMDFQRVLSRRSQRMEQGRGELGRQLATALDGR